MAENHLKYLFAIFNSTTSENIVILLQVDYIIEDSFFKIHQPRNVSSSQWILWLMEGTKLFRTKEVRKAVVSGLGCMVHEKASKIALDSSVQAMDDR